MRRIVFDIETVPFSDEFKNARSPKQRLELAPRMRVACALDVQRRRYHYFTATQSRALIDLLLGADQIISFNGRGFDLLVLRGHHGLTAKDFATLNRKRRHIDLCEIFSARIGRRVSLDAMARLNLGEGKMVSGRDMAQLSLKELKRACRSDVKQTYRLLRLHEDENIQFPDRRDEHWDSGIYDPYPHCHLPGRPGMYMPLETSEMSEGQEADYLAGLWGVTWSGRLVMV